VRYPRSGWVSRFSRVVGAVGRAALPVLATLLVAVLLVTDVRSIEARRDPAVSQPILFNHRKHTQELGLGCELCHKYVQTGRHSGLPGAETCGLCHRAPVGESAEAAKVSELLASGDPLRFKKLFGLPDYVFYTHRRHVGIAQLECVNCHDGIADTEVPPERPLVEIKMAFCVDCHQTQGVTTDCTSCHR
jgi:hypothetical protein